MKNPTNATNLGGKTIGVSIPAPTVNQDEGKALIVNSSGTGLTFGEAGSVDDVVNSAGQSVVTNKIAHLPSGTVQLLDQSVTFVTNTDNATKDEYPYRASVTLSGVTSSTYAEIVYSNDQATSLNYAPYVDTTTDTIYIYSRTNVGTVQIPTISIGMDYSDITIDSAPTSGSGNAVSSGGVYTNCVRTSGDQTISGSKTFSSTITGNLSGTATNATYLGSNTSNVGSNTKPVKIVDGQAVEVTNALVDTANNQTIGGVKTFKSNIKTRSSNAIGTADYPYSLIQNDKNDTFLYGLRCAVATNGEVSPYLTIRKSNGTTRDLALNIAGYSNSTYDGDFACGTGLILSGTAHISVPLIIDSKYTSFKYTGLIWGRDTGSAVEALSISNVTFTKNALGQWDATAALPGISGNWYNVLFQFRGVCTFS